ncbi:hypothetical protein NZD89_22535 [Alicyclobacillus fastidiosus]|uniref:Uncharacterized protein n=1 Tax=Alicyclobacillus fastidiosus TaxID=392011 RepID=A0ABY6ZE75_9BACL|nr:hypothetical protein [Alicyclobacillus fastidiosus]WAH41035.1 hypothetical protein NZD89_22535 [Alicyclobacillus fastidiosus]GMA62560.1 hypothetical protein GCM10025859_30000 [Alicyclobacillus fastidiosus]
MADGPESTTLQDNCLRVIQELLERGLANVHGLEQTLLREAIRRAYPRLESRIRAASVEQITEEIEYLRAKLNEISPEEPAVNPKGVAKRAKRRAAKSNRPSARTTGRPQPRATR